MRFASRLFSLGSLFLMTFTGAACGRDLFDAIAAQRLTLQL